MYFIIYLLCPFSKVLFCVPFWMDPLWCVSISTLNSLFDEILALSTFNAFNSCLFVCHQKTLLTNFSFLEFFFSFLLCMCWIMSVWWWLWFWVLKKVGFLCFFYCCFVCKDYKFSFLCWNHGAVIGFLICCVMCLVVPLFCLLFIGKLFSSQCKVLNCDCTSYFILISNICIAILDIAFQSQITMQLQSP